MKGSTGEFMVGDGKGVWRTRSIKRKVESERWDRSNMGLIAGVPWRIGKEMDGEELRNEVIFMDRQYNEVKPDRRD